MSCKESNKLSELLLNSKLKIINEDYGIGIIIQLIIQDLKSKIKDLEEKKKISTFTIITIKTNIISDIKLFLENIVNILEKLLKKKEYINLKDDIEEPLIISFVELFKYKKNNNSKKKFRELLKDFLKYLFNIYIKDNFGFYINEKLKKLKDNEKFIKELFKKYINYHLGNILTYSIFYIIESQILVNIFFKSKKNNINQKIQEIDEKIEEINEKIKITRINNNNKINIKNKIIRINNNNGTIFEQANYGSIIANLLLKLNYESPKYFDINFILSSIFLKLDKKIKKIISSNLFKSIISNIVNKKLNNYKSLSCELFKIIEKLKFIDIKKRINNKIALFGIIIDENNYNVIKKNVNLTLSNNNLKKFTFSDVKNINGLCELNKFSNNNEFFLNIGLICKRENIKQYYNSDFVLSYNIVLSYNLVSIIHDDIKNKIYGIINTINFLRIIYLFEDNKIKIKLSNIIQLNNNEYNIVLIFNNFDSKIMNFNKYIMFQVRNFDKLIIMNEEIFRPKNNLEKKEEILNTFYNILLKDTFIVQLVNISNKNDEINLEIKCDQEKKEYIIRKSCLFNVRDNEYLKINVTV